MHLLRVARRAAAWSGVSLAISACSLNFSEDGGGLPLSGTARDADTFPRLNRENVVDTAILRDDGGAIWAALFEVKPMPIDITMQAQLQGSLHLVRLDAADEDAYFSCDGLGFGKHAAYIALHDPSGSRIRVIRPGRGDIGFELQVPTAGELFADSHDRVFLYQTYGMNPTDRRQIIARPDDSFTRELPPRPQVQPDTVIVGAPARHFDASGDWLLRQDPDGRLWAYSTRDTHDIDLGKHDWLAGTDEQDEVAYTCGDHGLIRVPIDRSPTLILDSAPCHPLFLQSVGPLPSELPQSPELAYYSGESYYTVSKTGGPRTPLRLPPQGYLLAIGPQKQSIYSQEPTLYMNGWGDSIFDGWLGDWRFMDRGRGEHVSRDGRRLHWLENAARTDNTGELMGAIMSAGAPSIQLLARNVIRYDELDNGQLIAVSNASGNSLYSRIILVDEAAQRSQRVAEKSEGYELIPDRHEFLVKVRSSIYRLDVYRVPLPAESGLQVGR